MIKMTQLPGVPDRGSIRPGMAYFAGTGPYNTTCGQCVHRGYWKQRRKMDGTNNPIYIRSCEMHRKLSGTHGPPVDERWPSCKYFDPIQPSLLP